MCRGINTPTQRVYPDDPIFLAMTGGARKRKLVHVQCGIKIHDLRDQLENNFKFQPGVVLNDGPGDKPQNHGYAVKTLGGSGGQSIVGAFSTSVHGGDDLDTVNGGCIQPLPDMVQAIHLVGAGGVEFFIQRAGAKAVVDVAALENNRKDTWNNVSQLVQLGQHSAGGNTIADMRAANRFLQVLILPYPESTGDHTCFERCPQPWVRVLCGGPVQHQGSIRRKSMERRYSVIAEAGSRSGGRTNLPAPPRSPQAERNTYTCPDAGGLTRRECYSTSC